MKVVVLGASGNAGTALLRALDAEPRVEEVVAVARRPPGEWQSPKTTWRSLDIATDPLEPVVRGADVVVHLAWLIQPARDLEQTRAVNVNGSQPGHGRGGRGERVPALVYASSVGAYSRGPKDRLVDETWPTGGVPTSFYSRHKAEVERLLDGFELEHPDVRVVRLRPGLIFQRGAASEIRRLFAGPFLPSPLVAPKWIPIVPRNARLRFQAVHADDVADAYRRAIVGDARGAFNVAAEPVLDGEALGRLLDARPVPVPAGALRGRRGGGVPPAAHADAAGLGGHGPRRPADGQLTGARGARMAAARDAGAALLELLDGIRSSAGSPTPTLKPGGDGRLRAREFLTGVGARGPGSSR